VLGFRVWHFVTFLVEQSSEEIVMRKSSLVCVLLGAMAWGQATAPPAAPPAQTAESAPARPTPPPDMSASVPANAAVITVKGVCSTPARTAAGSKAAAKPASSKTPAAECKTVITKAEFEKLASGLAPNVNPQLKRQLASILPRLIAMSAQAKQKGLDKTPQFQETVKFAKMQILTSELQRKIQAQAADVPKSQIEQYYKDHPDAFEQFNLDRLFVPRTKQENEAGEAPGKDEKLTDDQKKAKEEDEKAKQEQGEQEMTKLADTLRQRAVAGEDFMKLQKEAFEAAGMKIESPTVNLPSVRRTGLPPGHVAVFDLKPGDVSQIISDAGGHYIYKVISKEELPLDAKVENEIHSRLQNERTREMMDKVNNSFTVVTNEAYFGPPGPGGPPPRMPRPHMVPSPTTPAPRPGAGPAQPNAAPQAPAQAPPAKAPETKQD